MSVSWKIQYCKDGNSPQIDHASKQFQQGFIFHGIIEADSKFCRNVRGQDN